MSFREALALYRAITILFLFSFLAFFLNLHIIKKFDIFLDGQSLVVLVQSFMSEIHTDHFVYLCT